MFESQVSRRNCQTFSTGFTPDLIRGGAFGRQRQEPDIGGDGKRRRGVRTGLIEDQHGMGSAGDMARNFGQMRRHRFGVALRHDEACGFARQLALGRADGTEDMGRCGPLIFGCRASCAPFKRNPKSGDRFSEQIARQGTLPTSCYPGLLANPRVRQGPRTDGGFPWRTPATRSLPAFRVGGLA